MKILHVQIMGAKAVRIFFRLYSFIRSELLSVYIKLTVHKTLIRSVMTYACPTCEFACRHVPLFTLPGLAK